MGDELYARPLFPIMFDKALSLFIFITCLWYYGENGIILNASKIFTIGTLGLFFIAMTQRPKRHIKLLYPSFFFGYCLLNFVWYRLHHIFLPTFLAISFGALLFYLVCVYSEDFQKIVETMKWILLVNIAMAFLQKIGLDPIFDQATSVTQLHGFFERTSSFSAFAVLMFPLMSLQIMVLLFCLPNFSGVIVGATQFSILWHGFYKHRLDRIAIPFVVAIALAFLYVNRAKLDFKYNSRKDMLFTAVQATCLQKPAFGFGLGSFRESTLAKDYNWDTTMKCEPIEWFMWTGFLGIVAVFFWLRDMFLRFWRYRRRLFCEGVAIFGFLLISLTQGIFQDPKLMAVFLPFLAWFYIKTEEA